MLKVRVVVIFARTNSCVKDQNSCDLYKDNTCVSCVKGQSSCDLFKD